MNLTKNYLRNTRYKNEISFYQRLYSTYLTAAQKSTLCNSCAYDSLDFRKALQNNDFSFDSREFMTSLAFEFLVNFIKKYGLFDKVITHDEKLQQLKANRMQMELQHDEFKRQ